MRDWVLLCTDIEGHDQSGEFKERAYFFIRKFNPNLRLNFHALTNFSRLILSL